MKNSPEFSNPTSGYDQPAEDTLDARDRAAAQRALNDLLYKAGVPLSGYEYGIGPEGLRPWRPDPKRERPAMHSTGTDPWMDKIKSILEED